MSLIISVSVSLTLRAQMKWNLAYSLKMSEWMEHGTQWVQMLVRSLGTRGIRYSLFAILYSLFII